MPAYACESGGYEWNGKLEKILFFSWLRKELQSDTAKMGVSEQLMIGTEKVFQSANTERMVMLRGWTEL